MKMATEQPESVIAKLMGFNEPSPSHEPFHKQCRVLSDWYIERAASVGAHRTFVRRSCSFYGKNSPASKALGGVSKNEYDTHQNSSRSTALQMSLSPKKGGVIVPELLSVRSYNSKEAHSANGSDRKPIYILSHLQGLECDTSVARGRLHAVEKPGKHSTASGVFGPNSVKATHGFKDIQVDAHSKAVSGAKIHHGLEYRNPAVSNIMSPKCSQSTRNGTMNMNCQQQKSTSNPQAVFGPGISECYSINQPKAWGFSSPRVSGYTDYIRTRCVPVKSSLSIESVSKHLETWKIPKEVDNIKVFERGQNIDEMHVSANRNFMVSSLNARSGRTRRNLKLDLFSRRDNSKKKKILQKDSVEPTDGSDYTQPEACVSGNLHEMGGTCVSKSSNINPSSQTLIDEKLDNTGSFSTVFPGISAELQAESTLGALSMEEKHHSDLLESFSNEVLSLDEFSEKESTDSFCSRLSPGEFQDYFKGNNQRSPGSVLESFEQQKPNFSECLESMDMLLLLQDLDSESDETYSEGSVMVVSGDEDSEEGSSDLCCDERRKIHKWSEAGESRNFSYLVDVLDEAGLCSVKSFMDLKNRDSIERPISYMVFESLEKKYGKQNSWPKSERRLLFDRINAGLMDIIDPATNTNGRETSTRRCFSEAWKRDNIEDALWMMLINEEKEKIWDLSTKALGRAGKWMELEEETSIICRELEGLIFDELVMELISETFLDTLALFSTNSKYWMDALFV